MIRQVQSYYIKYYQHIWRHYTTMRSCEFYYKSETLYLEVYVTLIQNLIQKVVVIVSMATAMD